MDEDVKLSPTFAILKYLSRKHNMKAKTMKKKTDPARLDWSWGRRYAAQVVKAGLQPRICIIASFSSPNIWLYNT